MDSNPLKRFAQRFGAACFKAQRSQKPKLGLPVLKAARAYRESLDAAASLRRDLVAAALGRCEDANAALEALNELAACFKLPAFGEDELAGR